MEKLVHCDKIHEFVRRQEPINAHHNGTAANVAQFHILVPYRKHYVTTKWVWTPTPHPGQERPASTTSTDRETIHSTLNDLYNFFGLVPGL